MSDFEAGQERASALEDIIRAPLERPPGEPRRTLQERRDDRRQRPTRRFSRFTFLGGRRERHRRQGERAGSFVDRYSTRMVLVLLWTALMNVGDSFFTLLHLQSGGVELNPVADAMLQSGRLGFVLLKSLLICAPLLVLCLHKNFPLARFGIWAAAWTYTVLLGYHLYLLR